ncbi:membrane protein [Mycobacterium sp. ST-F2]|uniref:MMPL family transporter n=1 Tax=Mycobacterium sp. ST-F2 TaxID=1490484 RepID=UPI0009394CE9|nr:MMPL family transporter [Mycobacterium sp. ST-F2]OKH84983.1 membrane protein [Mycobacterium sp. ST-F2]
MFAWWGRTVYRFRYIVIGVMVALCLGGAVYGSSLGEHVTQSGFYNEGSESVAASVLGDEVYGRDRTSLVVAILTPPDNKKITDPAWQKKVSAELDTFVSDHKDKVVAWVGWLKAPSDGLKKMTTQDLRHTFITVPLKGDNDDAILKNYQAVAPDLYKVNGGNIKLAGLEPLASELTGTIGTDQKRAELAIVPLVAVVLFFVFGGAVAAALPAIIGGLTIGGALGILRFTAEFGPVHFFAQPVVTMMGFGIAIDYGLFIVSRFREELAEGYDVEAAVRRSVMTSGRTVAFSAVIIVASSLPLLLIPLGFLRSITYAIIASVLLAAFLSNTVLPAVLGILGTNVDALGVRTLLKVPFLANWPFSRKIIDWFAEKTQKTKTREEVEKGFWGKLVNVVMKRPLAFAVPITIGMILLVIPLGQLALAGMSEKYLPPDNSVRVAQEEFDKIFPGFRTNALTLVIKSDNGQPVTDQQIAQVRANAATISGFVMPDDNDKSKMWAERTYQEGGTKTPSVRVLSNGLVNSGDASEKINELRALQEPHGVKVMVGGTPALEQDSISTLYEKLPLMGVILVITTTILMFLAFGSLVLPIKAALMSALTLGSTMGILTWMFVENGHGSGLMNYTAQPLMAPMIGLIIAVIWGLSTDYEVFLVSRMVEARERGMSTAEAIRIGTATTGRLITGAALVLAVVVGAFAFSDLVMMKYLAFGLLMALLLDATVIRMFLVPAVMKLLGDDCWWAPLWMKRIQQKLGLGETELPDERKRPAVRDPEEPRALVGSGAPARAPHDPTHPAAGQRAVPTRINPGQPQPPSQAPTNRMPSAPQAPAPAPQAPPAPPAPPVQAPESEPATTRFSAAKAFRNVVSNVTRAVTPQNDPATTAMGQTSDPATTALRAPGAARPADPSPGQGASGNREIESWLGQLRGNLSASGPQIQTPSDAPGDQGNEPTTAFRAQPAETPDATEKIDTAETQRRGSGGGVSAQDLLRREGRL